MRKILFSLIVLLAIGCASTLRREMAVDRFLPAADFQQAIADLESHEKAFGGKSRLLYLLNMGALNHYAGDYEESNKYFEEAYALADELYTKSITRELAGTVSPNMRPYYGEDYEKVMVNTFMALNYLKLGALDEALVEARRIDKDLELLTNKYQSKNKYKSDAFGRYLAGIIQEIAGRYNDAFISYVQAYRAYKDYEKMFPFEVPDQLKRDILRLASVLHFDDKYDDFVKEFGDEYAPPAHMDEDAGEVIAIVFAGLAPLKRELNIKHTGVDKDGKTYTFQLQIPVLVERPTSIGGVRVSCFESSSENSSGVGRSAGEVLLASGESSGEDSVSTARTASPSRRRPAVSAKPGASGYAFLAQDVSAIAKKNMDDKKAVTIAKAFAAALVRYKASEKLKEKSKGKSFWGNVAKGVLIDSALENVTHADIRCWRTLPARIFIYRKRLPPGTYDICADFVGGLRGRYSDGEKAKMDRGDVLRRSCQDSLEIGPGSVAVCYFADFN